MDPQTEQQNNLTILHFNDVYDIEPDINGMRGFVNFYHYVLHLKQLYPSSILAFSGDAFAPSKLSRVRKGWQMAHCLKMLKIDIACYGNHDFDYLPEHSLQLAKQCQVPWLLANVKYKNSQMNLGEGLDYYIIEKPGFKVGFIGLAGPDFKGRLISAYKDKLDYQNPTQIAKKLCKILKEKGCNLIVALTHMRIPADEEFAKNVPQIDLILGGHDHVVLSKIINKTPLLKSGKNFQHIGVYKIFRKDQKQQQKISHRGRNWVFKFNCPSIPKCHLGYPQLQKYIQQALKQYKQRGLAKPKQIAAQSNKAKIKQKLKQQWKFKYGYLNGKIILQISSKLNSQICFSKSVCFHRQMFFSNASGQDSLQVDSIQAIIASLKFVQKQISTFQKKENAIIYGPGFTSLPYIIQAFNFIYLPSQFSASFNSIQSLYQTIRYCNTRGVQCIGVIQLMAMDSIIMRRNTKCTVKIILLRLPLIYENIIKSRNTQNLVVVQFDQYKNLVVLHPKQSVFIQYPSFKGKRQCVSYQKSRKNQKNQQKKIQQNYDKFTKEYLSEVEKYSKILNESLCKSGICVNKVKQGLLVNQQEQEMKYAQQNTNIIDKSQQIDIYTPLEKKIQQFKEIAVQQKNVLKYQIKGTKLTIIRIPTQNINKFELKNAKIAYNISKQHIHLNRVQEEDETFRGIVFNQNQFCYPTYELAYGYIPILFKIKSKEDSQVLQILSKKELSLKKWFNLNQNNFDGYLSQKDWKHPVYELLRKENKDKNDIILKNSKNKHKTLQWVTKYAKKSYQDVKYLPFGSFLSLFDSLRKQEAIGMQ